MPQSTDHRPNAATRRPRLALEYALGGRRRRVEISAPVLGAAVLATALGIFAPCAWAYFAFRDDMLAELLDRQTRMRSAYEDQLADLRLRLDQATSRQFLDQGNVEDRMRTLDRRQARLETRAALVARLVEGVASKDMIAAAGDPRARQAAPSLPRPPETASAYAAAAEPRPTPFSGFDKPHPEGMELRLRRDDDAPAPSGALGDSAGLSITPRDISAEASARLRARLDRLALALDRVEREQTSRVDRLVEPLRAGARRLRRAFDVAGLSTDRFFADGRTMGARYSGGPFVPADGASTDSAFDRAFGAARDAARTLETLRGALASAPLRKPLAGEPETTSGFGYRTDPFFGRPALHTGIDLRDDYGAPVRATGGGVVVSAGPNGGYGQMVEIDHGGGLTTRYAHLASISVAEGQEVTPGATLGRLGSTGRSTGPHLHYEVRVDGEPVDPARFLRAAASLSDSR